MYIEFVKEEKPVTEHGRIWLRAELIERVEPGERKHPTTLILMANRDTHLEVRGDYRVNMDRIRNLNHSYGKGGSWSDNFLIPLD